MKLIQAKLIKQPRLVTTKHGPRVVADAVNIETGESLTIWRPHSDGLLNYNVNSNVTLCQDSKGKISLIYNQETTAITANSETNQTASYQLSKEQKQAIASYVSQQKDLLQICWKEASMIDGPCTEESIEKLTMALYIQTVKKFNLAN